MQFKTLALASLASAPKPVLGIGCYGLWKQGAEYVSGDIVSAIVPLNATAGTTQTKNFKCTSGSQPSLPLPELRSIQQPTGFGCLV
jgi:hypothetical protein